MDLKSIRRLFYRGKFSPKSPDPLNSMLLPPLLGLLLCGVCLAGTTFAWFTATQSTATQTIQAANYSVNAVVTYGTEVIEPTDGVYNLSAGTYSVNLAAAGDASTGYCSIDLGGTVVHTQQIAQGTAIAFSLKIEQATTLKILAQWGTSARDSKIVHEGVYDQFIDVVGIGVVTDSDESLEATQPEVTEPEVTEPEPTEPETTEPEVTEPEVTEPQEIVYIVQSGDTLYSIAMAYGTTVEALAEYNDISNTRVILVDEEIRIPAPSAE